MSSDNGHVTEIEPRELYECWRRGEAGRVIDVRSPMEFATRRLPMAELHPLDELDPAAVAEVRDAPLVMVCRSGSRSADAARRMAEAGYGDVRVVAGGTERWAAEQLPVIEQAEAFSIERQVRIAAGGLVLIGAVLALTVSVWFALLPAFIGGGLVFAGITNTCGMGMVMLKMPWNRRAPAASCCASGGTEGVGDEGAQTCGASRT